MTDHLPDISTEIPDASECNTGRSRDRKIGCLKRRASGHGRSVSQATIVYSEDQCNLKKLTQTLAHSQRNVRIRGPAQCSRSGACGVLVTDLS